MPNVIVHGVDMILDIFKEAYAIAKKKNDARILRNEKKKVAKVFNDVYTYRHQYRKTDDRIEQGSAMYGLMPKAGYAWMCPDCNKIHEVEECSSFSGLQYPACCNTRAGHRLYEKIKSK